MVYSTLPADVIGCVERLCMMELALVNCIIYEVDTGEFGCT